MPSCPPTCRLSLALLNDYAARAGRSDGPAMVDLNHHFSPAGRREPKDVDSFWLVSGAVAIAHIL